ncbi:MAG TPA: oxidoreductase [Gammaproteobacteria bacterium]|jgi:alcohol dehydrogenase|nr:YhdH/YhfP family quinone oxidoreductase [Gammaproteobacteria bacterium]MDP6732265.1 YhdH/YhfP family quinone oxidoreductase [Gammaproteobacteria bacterium]HAJ74996.1 oxidoreductase [Gammaproteobacteria bacterium]|tara:strand:- start:97 stop:1089 length:993 start_codon:yes stop_codon:yes gene_type:complete
MEFKALQVSEVTEREFTSTIVERNVDELPQGEVLIEVSYSSINYKDALSASGNKSVTRNYPHTPGIDASGIVRSSSSDNFKAGDEVIVTGYDLGMNTAGGFGQYIRVPAAWVLACPEGLNLRDSMILGTAGFTAALCIEKLIANGLRPEAGDVLVTGATGGVGIVAVMLLKALGYSVVASTGKKSAHETLLQLGASEILDREELSEANPRPLLKERWAAAVDVAGGDTLCNVIKALNYGASVAACGLVQSPVLQASVLPFILRGVNLLGVDSVELPLDSKQAVWAKLAGDWKLAGLDAICTEIGLEQLDASLSSVLSGQATGRFLLNLQS